MQCVYSGRVTLPGLPKYTDKNPLGGLITLYLLADKLNDSVTANLVVDEIIRISDQSKRIPTAPC